MLTFCGRWEGACMRNVEAVHQGSLSIGFCLANGSDDASIHRNGSKVRNIAALFPTTRKS